MFFIAMCSYTDTITKPLTKMHLFHDTLFFMSNKHGINLWTKQQIFIRQGFFMILVFYLLQISTTKKKRWQHIIESNKIPKKTPMQGAFLHKVIGYRPLSCDNVSLWELCRILKILWIQVLLTVNDIICICNKLQIADVSYWKSSIWFVTSE